MVSDFSHLSVCTVLSDWGAFWSTAATPPHCQTELGGEDPSALPLPRSSFSLPHPTPPCVLLVTEWHRVCLWQKLLGGEATATGKQRELWKRHMLNQRGKRLEPGRAALPWGCGAKTTPWKCVPAVRMVHVSFPHPAHHFVCKKQKESQGLHNFLKQSNWTATGS